MNNTFYSQNDYRNYIAHFGVKGMKWGVRRYQNSNGSYTSAGKRRYGVGDGKSYSSVGRRGGGSASPDQKAARRAKLKKAALAVGGAAALAGAGYLGYKYRKNIGAAAQGLAGRAKEAGFQARVRGENAAYVAKNRLRGAAGQARLGAQGLADRAKEAGFQARVRGENAAYVTKNRLRGAAGTVARKARFAAQGAADRAKEAGFQARVRGENAAYVGGKAVRSAASNRYVRSAAKGVAAGAVIGGTARAIVNARRRKEREQRSSANNGRRGRR